MNKIIEKSRTISEKKSGYSQNTFIDYRYLTEWRDVKTLLNEKYFDIMLKETGFSKEEFAYSLQPNNEIEITEDDKWYKDFIQIIDSFDFSKIDYKVGIYVPSLPFSKHLLNHIEQTTKQMNKICVSEDVINSFVEAHLMEIFNINGKLLAASLERYKKDHDFKNKSKTARFQEFLRATFYSKESFLKFFEEYPVAARITTIRTSYLIKNFVNMLNHLENDSNEIKDFFKINKLNLTKLKLSTGDSHEQGKSVSILEFGNKKIVYKPKNLKVSEAFEGFIDWYANNSKLLPIKIPKGIYKNDYSYNEFIEFDYCKNEKQVERFYLRYGYLIAICYLLGLNDLHMENIIAAGENPVIVDIETIFQNIPDIEISSINMELTKYIEIDSVLNSCLLPKKIDVGFDDQVELSALKGQKKKLSQLFLTPVGINTENFRYEKKSGYFEGASNIPQLVDGNNVDYQKYRLNILEGFNEFMSFILENKKECIEKLNSFKGLSIRSLIKGTEKYASMLRYSDHPCYNNQMKYRERLMMNIWAYPYSDKRIIKSEVNDLLFNDIPIFYTYTDSKDLTDSRGFIYKNYYEKTGLELATKRIEQLSKKEIRRQQTIMYLSLELLDDQLNKEKPLRDINFSVQEFDYIKQAKLIADQIIEESYLKDGECSFIDITCDNNKHWHVSSSDESLSDGLSGIALFFLELYMKTRVEKYLNYYKKIIHTAVNQAKYKGLESAYTGWLSPVYPLLMEMKYLNTLSEEEYINLTIEKIESLSLKDIDKLQRGNYGFGMSSIVRLLSLMSTFKYKNQLSDKSINKFLESTKNEIVNNSEKVEITYNLSELALAYASQKKMNDADVAELLFREYKTNIFKDNKMKQSQVLSGMIQDRLEILKLRPASIELNQLNDLIERFYKSLKKMKSNDTIFYGNGNIIITLKMLYEYSGEERWKENLKLWMSNLTIHSIFNGYGIPSVFDLDSKGLFNGLSGIGWLYIYVSGSINNVLMLT